MEENQENKNEIQLLEINEINNSLLLLYFCLLYPRAV